MDYMIRRTLIARLFVAAALIAASANSANAALLPVSVSITPEQSGSFRWTYNVSLPSGAIVQSGNYFTVYDFAGYVPGSGEVFSAQPDGAGAFWHVSVANLGPTPERLDPQDDPNLANITFTYTGGPTITRQQLDSSNGFLGNFALTSTFGDAAPGFFTGTNKIEGGGNATDSNIADTSVPTGQDDLPDPGLTPEPTTLALAGLGLPLIGLARILRRRKEARVA